MRLIGKDIATFLVGPANPPVTSYLTTLKEVSFDITGDMQENGALRDAFHFREVVRQDWTATFRLQMTDTAFPALFAYCPGQASSNGTIYIRSAASSTGASGLNLRFDGAGVISGFRLGLGENAQEAEFTLTSRSLLTMTGV